jgi:epoxyqueuosine reductase
MALPSMESPEGRIKRHALELGFAQAGIAGPDAASAAGLRFAEFLALDRHGEMDWLAAHAARRQSANALWPEARSVIALAENYGPGRDPLAALAVKDRAAISVYAQGADYHQVVKKRLKALARWVAAEFGAEVKVFVDTAPVMEKPLAQAAGIGWQGKHTNLVSREFGSWLFLGAIFTTLDLRPDAAGADHCGDCRRCLDVCPTSAFPAPYQLDARRCISYLTIEHKGIIPREFRGPIGNRIYGCDDCLAVCPWNKFAQTASEAAYQARENSANASLVDLARLDDAGFRRRFAGSPIKRTGRDRLVRNVAIALGNSGDAAAVPVLRDLLRDSAALVRGMAVWGLSRLTSAQDFADLSRAEMPLERDENVLAEWRDAGAAG